jgi:cytochrome c peroxidase
VSTRQPYARHKSLAVVVLLSGSLLATGAQELAPGWAGLEYKAPEPGSYRLPPLGAATDGDVLDDDGDPHRLLELAEDKIVAVSFFYRSCCDINGCPLATSVFAKVAARMRNDVELRENLQLVSLSFDPDRDTPEALRIYRDAIPHGVDWRFLTTASRTELGPVLDGYGLTIARDEKSGIISHRLRVFLIGKGKQIRNIYSADFLHPDILINDVRSLLMEAPLEIEGKRFADGGEPDTPGRTGPPLGLPQVRHPDGNRPTPAKRVLGEKLFFDRRLSGNGTMSCAMCHVPGQAFTHNGLATSVGMEGQTVRRNPPTLLNAAYVNDLFHDGREKALETQVWGPLLNRNEMGNTSADAVVETIRNLPDYAGKFEAAFGGRPVSRESVGKALAAYQRGLLSGNFPFDRWHFGERGSALGESAKRGFRLFSGRAGCVQCHTIGKDHALFSDGLFHNTGIAYKQAQAVAATKHPLQIAPGVIIEVEKAVYAAAAEKPPMDLGRSEATGNTEDRWRYRTPTLRNVARTGPYMHDGSITTLEGVVDHYNSGGASGSPGLSPLIRPLGMTLRERRDLVSFLRALSGTDEYH